MSGQVPEEASISATLKSGSHPLPPAVDPTRLPHLPGLDGLRGLAVIGAILFHSGFSWAKGGFLGVSTFFVLSGFLITNLLIREWDTTGTIRLKRFWARRFRRLLPAALLTLLLVALIWTRLGTAEQIADLRYDTLAALAYVANWRFYLDGTSYAEVFGAPSPLQHFWSLAIEEQFYLLFPPAVLVVMEIGGRRLLASSLCAAIAVSIGLVFILGTQIDRIYYGTDTRAAELLAGALFALWWTRPHTVRSGRNARQTTGSNTAGDVVGLGAMAAMFCAWWSVSHTSELLSYGGLPLYAILTTIIIHAAIQPGRVARLLSLSPLRWIGLISYGLYLYHWPVFLILDEQRLGLGAAPLFVVQMTVTTLIAVASYFLLEMPIRRGRLFQTDRAVYGAAFSGAIVVAICAVFVTRNPPTVTIPYADVRLEDFSSAIKAKVVEQSTGTTASTTDRSRTGVVMFLGDSGMVDVAPALRTVFEAAGARRVLERAYPGVGLSNPLLKWREAYAELVNKEKPDLVIMMIGGMDIKYLETEGADAYASIVQEAADILTARGAKLLWLSMLPGGKTPDRPVNPIFKRLADQNPGKVAYADIETSLRAPPGARSPVTTEGAEAWPRSYIDSEGSTVLLRKPDFWHLCPIGAEQLATAINHAAATLGWASEAPPGWQEQDRKWWTDHRYDEYCKTE